MTIKAGRNLVTVIDSILFRPDDPGKTASVNVRFADEDGDTITAHLYLSDAALPWTAEKLLSLGYDSRERGFEPLNDGIDSPIAGAEAAIKVKIETYQGRERMKVDGIFAPGGMAEPMAPKDAATFSDLLTKKLRKMPRPDGATAAVAKPAGHADEDVPF